VRGVQHRTVATEAQIVLAIKADAAVAAPENRPVLSTLGAVVILLGLSGGRIVHAPNTPKGLRIRQRSDCPSEV
jgi:hypothetical protein